MVEANLEIPREGEVGDSESSILPIVAYVLKMRYFTQLEIGGRQGSSLCLFIGDWADYLREKRNN